MGAASSTNLFIKPDQAIQRFTQAELTHLHNVFDFYKTKLPQSNYETFESKKFKEDFPSLLSKNFSEYENLILLTDATCVLTPYSFHQNVLSTCFPIYLSNKLYSLFATSYSPSLERTTSAQSFNRQNSSLDSENGVFTPKKLQFIDLICCLSVLLHGTAKERTLLVYYLHLDTSNIDFKLPLDQQVKVTYDSFKKTAMSSESPHNLSYAANSFLDNSADIVAFEDFSYFITFYQDATKLISFLSSKTGYSDCNGNTGAPSKEVEISRFGLDITQRAKQKTIFSQLVEINGKHLTETDFKNIESKYSRLKHENGINFTRFQEKIFPTLNESLQKLIFNFFDTNNDQILNFKEICYGFSMITAKSDNLEILFEIFSNGSTEIPKKYVEIINEELETELLKSQSEFVMSENLQCVNFINLISDYLTLFFNVKLPTPKDEGKIISRFLSNRSFFFYENAEYSYVPKSWFLTWADYTIINDTKPGVIDYLEFTDEKEYFPLIVVQYFTEIYQKRGLIPLRKVIKNNEGNDLQIEKKLVKIQIWTLSNAGKRPEEIAKMMYEEVVKLSKGPELSVSTTMQLEDLKNKLKTKHFRIYSLDSKEKEPNYSSKVIISCDSELKCYLAKFEEGQVGNILIEKRHDQLTWPVELITLKEITEKELVDESTGLRLPGRIGIINIGNSCFMNAGLQVLLHLDIFSAYFSGDEYLALKSSSVVSKAVANICRNVKNHKNLSVVELKVSLTKYLGNLVIGRQIREILTGLDNKIQMDCQEFISTLLDTLEIENPQLIQSSFYGKTQTIINKSEKISKLPEEKFSFIQLALPEDENITVDPLVVLQDGLPIRYRFTIAYHLYISDLLSILQKQEELKDKKLLVCEVVGNRFIRSFSTSTAIKELKLEALYIYELPRNCSSLNDCFKLTNRRFIDQDFYFNLPMKSTPILFSHPILVSKTDQTLESLYEITDQLINRMLTIVPEKLGNFNVRPYTLHKVNEDGMWAGTDWTKFLRKREIEVLSELEYIAIDWENTQYDLRFITGSENFCISKTIPFTPLSIEKCVESHFAQEVLDNGQQLHKMNITEPPKVLLLQLQRACLNGKCSYPIEFGKNLDIKIENGLLVRYSLKAFAAHQGQNMNYGHYVAVARTSNDQWFEFNDSIVTKLAGDKIFEKYYKEVYVLAYEKDKTESQEEIYEIIDEEEIRMEKTRRETALQIELNKAQSKHCVMC